MADILRIGGKEYEFPKEATSSVLEDCEEEINAFLEIRSMPLGKQARSIRVLTHHILAQKYPDLRAEDVKLPVSALGDVVQMIIRSLGLEAKEGKPGEAGGPPA